RSASSGCCTSGSAPLPKKARHAAANRDPSPTREVYPAALGAPAKVETLPLSSRRTPLIRCPKCGQAYDVPGVIAVRLPNSIATCHCGEWLSGSKAAILARMLDPSKIKEVDLQPYRVEAPADAQPSAAPHSAPAAPSRARSIRIIARGAKDSIN